MDPSCGYSNQLLPVALFGAVHSVNFYYLEMFTPGAGGGGESQCSACMFIKDQLTHLKCFRRRILLSTDEFKVSPCLSPVSLGSEVPATPTWHIFTCWETFSFLRNSCEPGDLSFSLGFSPQRKVHTPELGNYDLL